MYHVAGGDATGNQTAIDTSRGKPTLLPMMRSLRVVRILLLFLVLSGSVASSRPNGGVADYGLAPDSVELHQQVHDPLFAFVFSMAERDSLGTWTAADLLVFSKEWGEDSVFPLAGNLASLTREALPDGRVRYRRGVRCNRRWVVRFAPARLEIPMPYSILGYHPGSLSFDSPLTLFEWRLGERTMHVTVEGSTRRYACDALTVFQIASGWIVLDIDGWIDRLLGKAADDAAMEGFAVGWIDGQLVGVGNSVGRKGRRMLGELNFRSDEVETHGRPVARGLSTYSRGWTSSPRNTPRTVWERYERR